MNEPPQVLMVDYTRKGEFQRLYPNSSSLSSSHDKCWKDITVDEVILPGLDFEERVAPHHMVTVLINPLESTEISIDGVYKTRPKIFPGNMSITPAGASHKACWDHEGHFINFSFSPTWLERINTELLGSDCVELVPHLLSSGDHLVQGILNGFIQEIKTQGLGGEVYIDQLKTTLALHLLRNYISGSLNLPDYAGGLSRYQLRQALDYIEANLHQSINLDDIARRLHMSQYHFCRLFKDSMGVPPYKYVISQRVERAKRLMREFQHLTIAEIALDCGFSNQSHLCNHFRKLTGITPRVYKQEYLS